MKPRAAASSKLVAHFRHLSGASKCPSSIAAKAQYLILKPVGPNVAAARALRSQFKRNWRQHWACFTDLTDHGSVSEFVTVLERANRLRIWEYRGLAEEHIPYVLATLADFPVANSIPDPNPPRTPQRQHWLRFWFEGAARTLEGRWNATASPPGLMRADMIDPGTGKRPSKAAVVNVIGIPLTASFLGWSVSPGKFVVDEMADFFKNHPKLFI